MSFEGSQDASKPRIAIVGGGIVGVILALGLLRRRVSVRVYEQGSGFRELGAGIAFTACARRCMTLIDPVVVEALRRCGAVSVSGEASSDGYLRWIDGYNQHRPNDPSYQRPLEQIGGNGFHGCRRDQFLEELAKELPSGVIEFRRRLETMDEREDGRLRIVFADGAATEVDAVIGCDGIKSRVRQYLLGPNHPGTYPQYTHKVAYRGLVPMTRAIDVLGEWKANNFHHHVGPGAHLTHYPVANHTAINVTIFLSDPKPWPDPTSLVASATPNEVMAALIGWHPTVLSLVQLLPDQLIKWALFDLGEFPAPRYNQGRVCIAGDAAHASSPHHGASACLGVEDALCLSTLLGQVQRSLQEPNGDEKFGSNVTAAFVAFDAVRRGRTQWLVNSSRRVCDLYHQVEWADPIRWVKAETCFEEIRDRSYKIWHFDVEDMVEKTLNEFAKRVEKNRETSHESVCSFGQETFGGSKAY